MEEVKDNVVEPKVEEATPIKEEDDMSTLKKLFNKLFNIKEEPKVEEVKVEPKVEETIPKIDKSEFDNLNIKFEELNNKHNDAIKENESKINELNKKIEELNKERDNYKNKLEKIEEVESKKKQTRIGPTSSIESSDSDIDLFSSLLKDAKKAAEYQKSHPAEYKKMYDDYVKNPKKYIKKK